MGCCARGFAGVPTVHTQLLKAGFVRSAIEPTVVDYAQQQPSPVSAALGGVRWRQRFAEVFATSARIAASSRTLPSGSVPDTNPFLMLRSSSSAALMKALSEVKRF
jgi:hypothetical protein